MIGFNFSGNADQGAVYLFKSTGHFDHKFTASDGAAGDQFGVAIATCGKVVVVGAQRSSKNGVRTGATYVFDLESKAEVHKLTASDGAVDNMFGRGVAIYGKIIMVSACHHGFGAVYTFDAFSGDQLQKYTNTDFPKSWEFGHSTGLAIHTGRNVGIVGHPEAGSSPGAVYVFDLNSGTQIKKITKAGSNWFGASLCVVKDFLLIGCSGRNKVYVFDINANWTEMAFFGPPDKESSSFGRLLASSGPHFIVTAWTHDGGATNNGALYIGNTTAGTVKSKFVPMGISVTCI